MRGLTYRQKPSGMWESFLETHFDSLNWYDVNAQVLDIEVEEFGLKVWSVKRMEAEPIMERRGSSESSGIRSFIPVVSFERPPPCHVGRPLQIKVPQHLTEPRPGSADHSCFRSIGRICRTYIRPLNASIQSQGHLARAEVGGQDVDRCDLAEYLEIINFHSPLLNFGSQPIFHPLLLKFEIVTD